MLFSLNQDIIVHFGWYKSSVEEGRFLKAETLSASYHLFHCFQIWALLFLKCKIHTWSVASLVFFHPSSQYLYFDIVLLQEFYTEQCNMAVISYVLLLKFKKKNSVPHYAHCKCSATCGFWRLPWAALIENTSIITKFYWTVTLQ